MTNDRNRLLLAATVLVDAVASPAALFAGYIVQTTSDHEKDIVDAYALNAVKMLDVDRNVVEMSER